MDYGSIIKRAFNITWRYKALWVLGVFAGISGCQSGGGSNGGGSGTGYDTSSSSSQQDWAQFEEAMRFMRDRWEIIAGVAVAFVLVWIVWSIISIAAKGGLVVAANSADEGKGVSLSEAWSAGFSRWWSLMGLHLLLKLPLAVLGLGVAAAILVPIVRMIMAGNEPTPESFAPMCGAFLMIPVLLLLALVLDPMLLTALRYLMLGRQGTMDAVRNSWRFLRSRTKDSVVMYVLLAVLNIAAGIVIALLTLTIGGTIGASMVFTGLASGDLAPLTGLFALASVLIFAIIMIYQAVWGTLTSTVWTLFFRDVTGMSAPVMPAPVYAAPAYPAPPGAPASPTAPPAAPAPPTAPPAPEEPPA